MMVPVLSLYAASFGLTSTLVGMLVTIFRGRTPVLELPIRVSSASGWAAASPDRGRHHHRARLRRTPR